MRRALASTLVALAATTSLAACGDDSEPDTLPSSNTTRPPTVSAPSSSGSTTSTSAAVTDDAPDLSAVKVKLTTIAEGLERPVAFATRTGDTALYVAEQHTARVRAIRDGVLADTPVLDLGGEVTDGGEQGLLGIAFSADGDTLYVDFTDTNGDTRIQAFTMDGDVASEASRRELMLIDQPYPNHNGGQIAIGPDGLLYIALGDGGAGGDPEANAQNLASPLGKILRIDPTAGGGGEYQVPADNPFVDDADARPEIWHYGLRNPWRFSFDSATGEMWIGDVGQGEWEEVDIAPPAAKGLNFGWDRLEGTHPYEGDAPAGAQAPVWEASHADGNVAVTGGYVYRGEAIPDLVGAYMFADYGKAELLAITAVDGVLDEERSLGITVEGGIPSFGQDNAGELYVLSLDGAVYRIDPA